MIYPARRSKPGSPVPNQCAVRTNRREALAIGNVTDGNPVQANYDLRLSANILQLRQPLPENIFPFDSDIAPKVNHFFNCNI